MSVDVIAFVLFGALLHATWNAIIKAGTNKSLDAALVSAGGAVTALPFLPFLPMPLPAAWPFIGTSAILQFIYFQLVAAAYRAGDIGLVYPLMRGVAPLLIVATSGFILRETLSGGALLGVMTICAGILTLAFEARKGGRHAIIPLATPASFTYLRRWHPRRAGNPVSIAMDGAPLPVLLFPRFHNAARRGFRPCPL